MKHKTTQQIVREQHTDPKGWGTPKPDTVEGVEKLVEDFDALMTKVAIQEMRGEKPDTEKIVKDWLRTTLLSERTKAEESKKQLVEEIIEIVPDHKGGRLKLANDIKTIALSHNIKIE